MNDKLIYKDGKALIISNDDKIKEIDYYDNLNEVLQTENLIEKLDGEIANLEKEIMNDESKINLKRDILSYIKATACTPVIGYILLYYIFGLNEAVYPTIFGDVNISILLSGLATAIMGGVGVFSIILTLIDNREIKSVINGKKTKLRYLKKEKEIKKQEVLNLNEHKTCTKANEEVCVLNIKEDEKFDKINNNLKFYYDLGYNQQKHKKHFEKNKANYEEYYDLLFDYETKDNNVKENSSKKRVRKK